LLTAFQGKAHSKAAKIKRYHQLHQRGRPFSIHKNQLIISLQADIIITGVQGQGTSLKSRPIEGPAGIVFVWHGYLLVLKAPNK
jgi:hypothetical protein